MIQPPHASPLTHRQIVALALILVIGAGLRFYRIGHPSLWLDEIWSIEMACGRGSAHDQLPDGIIRYDQVDLTNLASAAPWWSIWTHLRIVIHPPLYFVLLRAWMDLFGNGPATTRCLSSVFSLLGILIFFDVCRLLHGPRSALLAAAVMTLSIAQIDIAQETRSYPQLICFSLCCCDALVRIQFFGATGRRLTVLAASLIATMLTHYFAAGALVALAIYASIRLHKRDCIKTFAAFAAASLLTLALWGWPFIEQMKAFPNFTPSFLREDMPHHPIRVLERAIDLPLQLLCGEHLSAMIPLPFHIVAAISIFLLPIIYLRTRPDLLLWILWIFGIVGSIALLDLAHDSMLLKYLRYTILTGPGVYAIVVNANRRPIQNALAGAIILSLAVLVGLRLHDGVAAKEDFRLLGNILDAHALPDELLVFYNQSDFVSPGAWYMCYQYYSPQTHHPWATLHRPPDSSFLRQLSGRSTLWLIGRQPEIDGAQILPGWQPEEFWATSAGRVCLMRRAEPSGPPVAQPVP